MIKYISNIICLFKGHKPEKYLTETDGYISTTRCQNCHNILFGGFIWKIKNIPPPNSTPNEVKKWEEYCENKWQKIREEFNNK